MQSEEFDKKVIEAAERHHPAYDEKAWNSMEKLLDKHLPRKKDSRRRALWLLLLLLLAGGGTFVVLNNRKGNNTSNVHSNNNVSANTPVAAIEKNNTNPGSSELSSASENKTDQPVNGNNDNTDNTGIIDNTSLINPGEKSGNRNTASSTVIQQSGQAGEQTVTTLQIAGGTGKKAGRKNDTKSANDRPLTQPVLTAVAEKKPATDNTVPSENKIAAVPVTNQPVATPKETVVSSVTANNPVSDDKKPVTGNSSENKNPETTAAVATVTKKEKKPSGKNTFLLSLSAGPDLSFAGGDRMGTVKLIGGGGVSYVIKDRISIHAGFYTGRKVYTTSPGSYNPPASWWNYYPNLQKVEADCKVYEIPLSVAYHFNTGSKQGWYAGAGISSLLMKKEEYNYYYKPMLNGPVYSRKWTIRNENNHYFSVLTFSAGYQRKISNVLTVGAEPYIKLPLAGVGFGKVKLNSMGVMFTVGVNPFGHHRSANTPASK